MWCNVPSSVLQNSTQAALICSADPNDNSTCVAICPNPDISGVGVRSAFYIQSLLNTLLVIFSRRDSVPSTWAATLMTGALVIAAMVQKRNQAITLHHAILTMNFATLSCISSLAVAPTLSIWRLTPREYYAKRLARDLLDDDEGHRDRLVGNAVEAMTGRHRKKIERAQSRQRLFLAIALLTQVVLQWAWGVVLFVSPWYSQTNCSGQTQLIFFLKAFTASDINDKYMVVWVLWLLFSLGITMVMTIVLALTSPARARSLTVRSSPASIGTRSSSTTRSNTSRGSRSPARPVYEQLFLSAVAAVPSWKDRPGQRIFWYNVVCVILWLVYIISSEIQIQANCLFVGENLIASFGQITALLLSLAPLWSLSAALYKWPEMQRKLARRRRREEALVSQVISGESPIQPSAYGSAALDSSDKDPGKDDSTVTTAVVVAATPVRDRAAPAAAIVRPRGPRSRPRTHARIPTLDGVLLARTTTEEWNEFEMSAFSRASS